METILTKLIKLNSSAKVNIKCASFLKIENSLKIKQNTVEPVRNALDFLKIYNSRKFLKNCSIILENSQYSRTKGK